MILAEAKIFDLKSLLTVEQLVEDCYLLLATHLGPILLTWFNYNPSMDK